MRIVRVLVAVGVVAALGPSWSCVDATEIDVRITTNVAASTIVGPQRAELVVGKPADGGLGTTTLDVQTNPVDATGSFGDLVIGPNGDIGADVAVRVVLGVSVPTSQCDATLKGCIAASRTLPYLPHHELVLPIDLDAACVGVVCPAGQTCAGGGCVNDDIGPASCDGGTCSIGDASVPPVDATTTGCDASACGCVDLQTDTANCGGCGVDCTNGTCTNGTCTLAAIGTAALCLGVYQSSIYALVSQGGMFKLPTNGGGGPAFLGPGYIHDVTSRPSPADLAYSYTDSNGNPYADDEGAQQIALPTGAEGDRIALDEGGIAWLTAKTGQVGYVTFGQVGTAYPSVTASSTYAWLAVSGAGANVYASLDVTQLCRVTASSTACYTSTTSPIVNQPSGVAVADPSDSNSDVYYVSKGTDVVRLDAAIAQTPSTFATGGAGMVALAWDEPTKTAYAISNGAVYKSVNGGMTVLAPAPNAVTRCIALDDNAVYWGDSAGGVFKHAK